MYRRTRRHLTDCRLPLRSWTELHRLTVSDTELRFRTFPGNFRRQLQDILLRRIRKRPVCLLPWQQRSDRNSLHLLCRCQLSLRTRKNLRRRMPPCRAPLHLPVTMPIPFSCDTSFELLPVSLLCVLHKGIQFSAFCLAIILIHSAEKVKYPKDDRHTKRTAAHPRTMDRAFYKERSVVLARQERACYDIQSEQAFSVQAKEEHNTDE